MAARTWCRECERSVVYIDDFGRCRKCAAAAADDGSYSLEDAARLALAPPAVVKRLQRELRKLRRAAAKG